MPAFRETLGTLGWVEARNLSTEVHYGTGDSERTRAGAAALVGWALRSAEMLQRKLAIGVRSVD